MARPRRVINLDQVEWGAPCKKRYGRATLTIRSRGGLTDDSELAAALARFQKGEASADEVVDSFVSVRLESHSPTFNRATADRVRVLALVASCSEEPKFAKLSPEAIAQALVAAREEEFRAATEAFAKLAESMTRSVEGSMRAISAHMGLNHSFRWAEDQTRALRAIQSQLAKPVIPPGAIPDLSRLVGGAVIAPSALNIVRTQLPTGATDELARTIRESLGELHQPVPEAILPLLTRQALGIADMSNVVSAGSRVILNQPSASARLAELATELDAVEEQGSVAALEHAVEYVAEQLDAELGAMERRQIKRDEEARAQATAQLLIAIYVAILLFLLQMLLTPAPRGPEGLSPPAGQSSSLIRP